MEIVDEIKYRESLINLPNDIKYDFFCMYLKSISLSEVFEESMPAMLPELLQEMTNIINSDEEKKEIVDEFLKLNSSKDPDYVFELVWGPVENLLNSCSMNTEVANSELVDIFMEICLNTGKALIDRNFIEKSEKYFKIVIEIMEIDKKYIGSNILKCLDEFISKKLKNETVNEELFSLMNPILNQIKKSFLINLDLEEQALLFSQKASILIRFKKYEDGLKVLRKCLKIYRNIGDKEISAQAAHLFYIARLHENMGNFELAKSTHLKIHDMSKMVPLKLVQYAIITRSNFYIGKFEYLKENFYEAYHRLYYFKTKIAEEKTEIEDFQQFLTQHLLWKDIFENDENLIASTNEMIDISGTKMLGCRSDENGYEFAISLINDAKSVIMRKNVPKNVLEKAINDVVRARILKERHFRNINTSMTAFEYIELSDIQSDLYLAKGDIKTTLNLYKGILNVFDSDQYSYDNKTLPVEKDEKTTKCYPFHVAKTVSLYQKLNMHEEIVEQLETTVQKYKNEEQFKVYVGWYDDFNDFIQDLSESLGKLGHWSRKLELQLESLDVLKRNENNFRNDYEIALSFALWNIGFSLLNLLDFHDSMSNYRKISDDFIISQCSNTQKSAFLYHKGVCFYHLKDYSEAYRNLKRSLNLKPEEFLYGLHMQMALVSFKQRKHKYVRENLKMLMEPKPNFMKLNNGQKQLLISLDLPVFLNIVTSKGIWKKFPYSSKKNVKKEWRIFKNSSLISHHVRKAFKNDMISAK